MMCFNVKKRGEKYIALPLSSAMPPADESVTPYTALFGEGLTAHAAIADLCNQLDMEHDAETESKRKALEAQRW